MLVWKELACVGVETREGIPLVRRGSKRIEDLRIFETPDLYFKPKM